LLACFVDVEVGDTLIISKVAGNKGKLMVKLTHVRNDEEIGRTSSKDIVELGSAGLPVGVQVVARPWREHVALALMRAIEEAACMRDDYPGVAEV
jgi:hypothetical protein